MFSLPVVSEVGVLRDILSICQLVAPSCLVAYEVDS